MAIVLCIVLVLFGICSISIGFMALAEKGGNEVVNRAFFSIGIGGGVWCVGYALMGMTTDLFWAYQLRAVALFGVFWTIRYIIRYLQLVSNVSFKNQDKIDFFILIGGILCYILVAVPMTVTFKETSYGHYYVSNPWFGRYLQYIYILVMIVLWFYVPIEGLKKAKHKRERVMAGNIIISGVVMVLGMVFDTIVPMFGQAAFPSSAFGAFFFIMILRGSFRHYNAMGLASYSVAGVIFKKISTPVLIVNDEFKVIENNNNASIYLTGEPHQIENTYLYEWVTGIEETQKKELAANIVNMAEGFDYMLGVKFGNKKCRLEASILYDEYREALGIICLLEDMTEKEELLDMVSEAKKRVQKAQVVKSVFISEMNEEILGTVQRTINYLQDKGQDEGLLEANRSMLLNLQDMELLAQVRNGELTLKNETFDMQKLLHDIVVRAAEKIDFGSLKFVVSISPSMPKKMIGDSEKIARIIWAFLQNSIFYTREGFIKLRISYRIRFGIVTLQVQVSDSGVGVRDEEVDAIFGLFTEGGKQTAGGGAGTALCLARELIDAMNGKLRVKSSLGKGTQFSFDIELKTDGEKGIVPFTEYSDKILLIEKNEEEAEEILRALKELEVDCTLVMAEELEERLKSESADYTTVIAEAGILRQYREAVSQKYSGARLIPIYSYDRYKELQEGEKGLCRPLIFEQLGAILGNF